MKNRSAPPCMVTPVVTYPDVPAAVAWLESAFGFRIRLKVGTHRTQMWFGSACIVAGETGANNEWATRSSVLLRVPDVDALCERAVKHGARLVHPPKTHFYGERQATLQDFAGHIWTLTQSVEDIEPSAWGGVAVEL